MHPEKDAVPQGGASSPAEGQAQSERKLEVRVAYLGAQDFVDSFPGGETVKAVKLAAMRFFGLEVGSHEKYVIVADDTVVDEKLHVRDLGEARQRLRLRLKDEPVKG